MANLEENDFVLINVCGMIYETLNNTLDRYPTTLLGNKETRQKYFIPAKNFYFFDRNRQCFEAILYYYQSKGLLIRPPDIPLDLFIDEVIFFELGDEAILNLREQEGCITKRINLPKRHWQRKLWKLFEYPDANFASRCFAWWSVLVIIISIFVICMESVPGIADGDEWSSGHSHHWFLLELGCIIWFTFEYMVRLISCPDKRLFMRSFLNIIDVLAILPYFITMSISMKHSVPFSVLRIVRLVRILRILKLTRHSLGLQILGQTLQASINELSMLVCFLFIGVALFSSAIFFAESGENDMFTSVPDAFWYSLVTMTTIGYGDKYPITLIGKLVGSLCVISGVLTIALPVPVIVSNFELFNTRARAANGKGNKKKVELTKS